MLDIFICISEILYTSVLLAISIANGTLCWQGVQVYLASASGHFLMTFFCILQFVRALLNASAEGALQSPRAPSTAQKTSKSAQVGPKSVQVCPKCAQVGPKSVQVGPKGAQVGPKSVQVVGPKCSQVDPECAQVDPN